MKTTIKSLKCNACNNFIACNNISFGELFEEAKPILLRLLPLVFNCNSIRAIICNFLAKDLDLSCITCRDHREKITGISADYIHSVTIYLNKLMREEILCCEIDPNRLVSVDTNIF